MAEDAKKPYGDVAYADPGYQKDKKKRYPVDTEAHARAAWSYINKASNASAYSSEDLSKVKARIRSACKKFGIEISDDSESKAGENYNEPIECRAAVQISPVTRNEIVFLPVGIHSITPVSGGIGKPIKVLVNSDAAYEMEAQREEISARTGKRVYFDFNHEDGPASFWPTSFHWRSGEGVVAKGEWSASGKRAVEGKDFRAFSPVFHVDDKHKNPAHVVCCDGARPNMGGLVNDPAFSGLPLWAKNDGSSVTAGGNGDNTTKRRQQMDSSLEELATLRAKNTELLAKIESLSVIVAKDDENSTAKAQLDAATAEQRATQFEIEAGELKRKIEEQEAVIRKRNKADAEACVKEAVKRGGILPKDIRTQNDLVAKATADPSFRDVINRIGRQGGSEDFRSRIVSGNGNGHSSLSVVADDPVSIYAKMARVLNDSSRSGNPSDKFRCAEEFAAIYAANFADTEKNQATRTRLINCKLQVAQEAIMAADVTDPNLGTIAGTLVTQRTLELLKQVFPSFTRFTTDFSDLPATFNQTVMTRIITLPPVITYSTATGWQDASAATTDVPVVINNHKGIPITFNEQLLASTMRRLFDEFAEASAYQLAKAVIDNLYANLTSANFPNQTIAASASFVRSNVIDIGVALTNRGVPLGLGKRTMLLWPAAFGNLLKDSTLVTYAAYQRPDIITIGAQPNAAFPITVDTFEVYTQPNMPSNNTNLVGFAGSKSALIIATRTPNDYTSIMPGASFGNVAMVTDPDLGITVMQVQYVNHVLGTATSRIALMFGTAAGQSNAGQLIVAAAGSGSSR